MSARVEKVRAEEVSELKAYAYLMAAMTFLSALFSSIVSTTVLSVYAGVLSLSLFHHFNPLIISFNRIGKCVDGRDSVPVIGSPREPHLASIVVAQHYWWLR